MIEQTSPKGRIIAAALRLAAHRAWPDISLADIAAEAAVTLADIRAEFASKSALLASFMRAIDDEVLASAGSPDLTQNPRDRLFEVIMARFDALAPYKAALASITAGPLPDPALTGALLSSQRWMLEAAGVGSDGLQGGIRTAGLASVYASVFRVWLVDDDPGLARTMAALDRRLRRGEGAMSTLDGICSAAGRIVSSLSARGRTSPGAAATGEPPAAATPSP